MKLIEKLAKECTEKRRKEIFANESQPTDLDWFIPVYEAGFRKAREMALDWVTDNVTCNGTLTDGILNIGESEE